MSLHAVFSPHSIAIIGASTQAGTVGNDLVRNLVYQGYKGKIYPINPKGGVLYGLEVLPSIKSAPGPLDLAIIAVPAAIVASVLKEALRKKIKAAIVISAGFGESGHPELEKEIKDLCEKAGVTLIGPNCLGVINPHIRMNASFAPTLPPAGNIAFISQSGALGTAILDSAQKLGLGFSKFISVGNKASTQEVEIIRFLLQDSETDVIILYAEQLTRLDELLRLAKKANRQTKPKPIIVLKAGRTTAGAHAAQSHTGSLAGNDAAYQALFAQSGIIRAKDSADLFLLAECFATTRLPKGNRVAVVTNAGGAGVLTADQIEEEQLKLAELSPHTQKLLSEFLPPSASIKNPIDILGDAGADRYEQALKTVLSDSGVDALIVILTPQSVTQVEETAKRIIRLRRQSAKPIVVSFVGHMRTHHSLDLLQKEKIATLEFPEPTAHGLAALFGFAKWRRQKKDTHFSYRLPQEKKIQTILKKGKRNQDGWLTESEALSLLEAAKIPLARWQVAKSPAEVEKAVKNIGGECVLKIISPDIIHKSEAGGVLLHITADRAKSSAEHLLQQVGKKAPRAQIEGILVMEQVNEGLETIVGLSRNSETGAVIAFGLGGIYTEVFKDVQFGLSPLTPEDAQRMITEVQFHPLLDGARGQTPLDQKALQEVLGRVSLLTQKFPQIAEIDLNPVIVFPRGKGVVVADARIRVY